MIKKLLNIFVFLTLLIQPMYYAHAAASQAPQPGLMVTSEGIVSAPEAGQMPGYPEPLQPIQYNRPGYRSTMNTDNRVALASEYAPWKSVSSLQSVDAQTVSASLDPLAGNHTLVKWDEFGMAVASSPTSAPVMVTYNDGVLNTTTGGVSMSATATPDKITIPPGLTSVGTTRVGDINGDGIDEVVAYSNYLQVGNLSTYPKFKGAPGIASVDTNGHYWLAGRGYDDQLWVSRDGGITWMHLGGTLTAGVSAASPAASRMDVLTLGTDHHVYRCTVTLSTLNTACSYTDLGGAPTGQGYFIGEPALAAPDANTFDVFVRGSDNTLWHRAYRNGAWAAWENLGGYITSSPGVVSFGGRLDVVARGYDNAVWHMSRASDAAAWSGWENLGGAILGNPAITAFATGVMEIYGVGTNDALWSRLYQNSAWGSWVSEGGIIDPSPAATVLSGTQKVVVDVRGTNGQTFVISRLTPGGAWSSYTMLSFLPAWGDGFSVGDWSNFVLGHFLPDGRMQAATPYFTGSGPYTLKLDLYTFLGGFAPYRPGSEMTVALDSAVNSSNHHLWAAASDVDGDGVDELALAVYDQGGNGILTLYIIKMDATGILCKGSIQVDSSSHLRVGITTGNYVSGSASPVTQQVALVDGRDNSSNAYLKVFSASASGSTYTLTSVASSNINWDEYNYGRGAEFGVASGDFGAISASGDKVDQVVVTGLSEHYSVSQAHDNYNMQVSVYKFDGASNMVEVGSEVSFEIYHHISPSNVGIKVDVVAADLDRDGQAEIVSYFERDGEKRADFWKWNTATSTLDQVTYLDSSEGGMNPPGLIFAGDFQGRGLIVGAPTYRVIQNARGLVAQISVPPRIKGINDGTVQLPDYSFVTATSEANFGSQSTSQFSLTEKSHWNLDMKASMTIGDEASSYLKLSLESTYGQDFEKTDTKFSALNYSDDVMADTSDQIVYSLTDFQLFEYPVYAGGQSGVTHMTVTWPSAQRRGSLAGLHFVPANTCGIVIDTGHEVNNPLSYPASANGLKDYSSANLLGNTSFTTGDKSTFNVSITNGDTVGLSKSSDWTVAAGIEGQYQAPIPLSLSFSVRGEYGGSTAATQEYTTTQSMGLTVVVSKLDTQYQYTLQPYVYWGSTGALMLDYLMTPGANTYWNTVWTAHPDLAFLRPWKNSNCGGGQENFSPEITFDNNTPQAGATVTATARVHNFSLASASGVQVKFYDGDPDAGGTPLSCSVTPFYLAARGYKDVTCSFTASGSGEKRIYAVVDPTNALTELDETNNKAFGRYTMAASASGSADPGDSDIKDGQLFSFTDPANNLTQFFAPFSVSNSMINYRLDRLTTLPRLPSNTTSLGSAGHTFSFTAQQTDDQGNWGNATVIFGAADHTIPPALVAVHYTDADIANLDESTLGLYIYSTGDWVNGSCGTIQRYPSQNLLLVPVCQTGTFSLMGTQVKFPLYLPVLKL